MSIVYVYPKKSIFNATDLVIVGRKPLGGRTALDDGTKTRISNLKHPMNMGDLLSVVGSLRWTRPFVPALFQAIAKWKLLLEPTGKNNNKLIPTEKTLRAFEHVKQMVADCKSMADDLSRMQQQDCCMRKCIMISHIRTK